MTLPENQLNLDFFMPAPETLPEINFDIVEAFPPKYDPLKSREVVKELVKLISHYDFGEFLDVCLAAVERREEDYLQIVKMLNKEKLDRYVRAFAVLYGFFMDGYYDDILGQYYQENFRTHNGYFITPFNVAIMMAEMTGEFSEGTICDPACGSGSLLLATKYVTHKKHGWMKSCFSMRNIYGVDIGHDQVRMCKLQLYLTNYFHMIAVMGTAIDELKGDKEA